MNKTRSACPWHQGQCAYTGTEPDRCPVCHALWSVHSEEHASHLAARMMADLTPERRALLRSEIDFHNEGTP
jgi:hypothetical protein